MNKEEISKLQERYKLTEEEYKDYCKKVILFFTTGKKSVENPRLSFVAGQAGAGKSKLIPVVEENFKSNAVISDYDMVRALHPNFDKASKEVPEDVHMALLPDANRANEDLRHYCRDNNMNLIYEGTMRGTPVFLEIASEFKESGYEIELALMSVPKLESYGSTLLRYATDLMLKENGRWVSKNVHDESYDKFIVTLTELSKRGLFDRAKVYRRGRESENGIPYQIYSTEGREFSNAIEAVLYGREAYRKDAVERYETMHDLVQEVFEQKAPELLPNLKEWEKLYEAEREYVNKNSQEK